MTTGLRLRSRQEVEDRLKAQDDWEVVDSVHDADYSSPPPGATTSPDWLTTLDREDQLEFAQELAAAARENGPVAEIIRAWRLTADRLSDPGRRAVLLRDVSYNDFEEVGRPE